MPSGTNTTTTDDKSGTVFTIRKMNNRSVESVIGQFSKCEPEHGCECGTNSTIFVPIFFHSTKMGYGLNANDVHSVYDQFGCFLFGFHLCHPFIVLLLDPWVAFYLIVTFIRIRSEFPIRTLSYGHSVWIEFNAVPVWIWIQLLCFFHQMKKIILNSMCTRHTFHSMLRAIQITVWR